MGYYMLLNVQDFMLYYFNYWPNMIVGAINICLYYATRKLFHDESFIGALPMIGSNLA